MTNERRPGYHICLGPDCRKWVPDRVLMCARHWFMVPLELRRRVWATWDDGRGQSSPEHREATWAAVVSTYPNEEG